MGVDGYEKSVKRMHDLKCKVIKAVKSDQIPGLRLLCEPDLAVIPLASDEFDIYCLATLLERKGWNMFTAQSPPCMSLCFGQQHCAPKVIDQWLADVKECVEHLRAHPETKPEGDSAVYGAAGSIPANILEKVMRSYVDVKMSVKPKQEQ